MSSVTTDIYSDAVDSVITNSFISTRSDPPFVSMAGSDTSYFASMLEYKAEYSKFGASIVSIFAGNNEVCELLFVSDEPNFMHDNKVDFASVSSAQTSNPKNISPDFLSKTLNIDNSLIVNAPIMICNANSQLMIG